MSWFARPFRAPMVGLALILSLVALPSLPSYAQQAPACPAEGGTAKNQARKLLQTAQRDLKAGRTAEALATFQTSYACDPQAAALLGIADAQRILGRLIEAYDTYQRLLDLPKLSDKEQKAVSEGMAEIQRRTGLVRLAVDPPDAVVEIDGQPHKDLGKPLRLVVGTHTLRIQQQGFKKEERSLSVDPQSDQTVSVKLQADVSTGTLVVKESKGTDGHLVIEGLDVGPLPWTGSLSPGQYSVWIVSDKGASEPAKVELVVGQTANVTLQLTPFPAPAPAGAAAAATAAKPTPCRTRDDCEEGKTCVDGECRAKKQKRRAVDDEPEEDLTPAKDGEVCGERECAAGLRCVQMHCVQKELAPLGSREGLALDWTVATGLAGSQRFPAPVHVLTARFDGAPSPYLRYHLAFGYININARAGLRIAPLGFGVPIPIWTRGVSELVVEPGVDVAMFSETALLDDVDLFASSALWGRVLYRNKSLFVTATPLSLEMVWLRGVGTGGKGIEAWTKTGFNYACGLGMGVLL